MMTADAEKRAERKWKRSSKRKRTEDSGKEELQKGSVNAEESNE